MKALTCEMCGSTNIIKEDGVYVCQSCGTKYSVEEAKKMMVEGTVDVKGTVKVDTSDELKNLYEIARRAKDSDNSEKAAKYYDMILVKDPSSWDANYYVLYYQAINCTVSEIKSTADAIYKNLDFVLNSIKENLSNDIEQKNALDEILSRNTTITTLLFNAARDYFGKSFASKDTAVLDKSKVLEEYLDNSSAISNVMYKYGDLVEALFGVKYSDIAVLSWKGGVEINKNSNVGFPEQRRKNIERVNRYSEKICKYDSSYIKPVLAEKSGCYVATSVYGSYDCPQVWTLRRYRDYSLDETWYGRLFIKVYYAISPTFVELFGDVSLFKSFGKKILDKFVAKLNNEGFKDTPYYDKY